MTVTDPKYTAPTLLYGPAGTPTHLLHSIHTVRATGERVWVAYDPDGRLVVWRNGPPADAWVKLAFGERRVRAREWTPLSGAPVAIVRLALDDNLAIAPDRERLHTALRRGAAPATPCTASLMRRLLHHHESMAELLQGLELPTPFDFFADTMQTCARGHTFCLYHQLKDAGCDAVRCTADGCDQVIPRSVFAKVKHTLSPTLHPFL